MILVYTTNQKKNSRILALNMIRNDEIIKVLISNNPKMRPASYFTEMVRQFQVDAK